MPKGIRSLANGGPSNPFGGPAITGGGGITPIKMQAAQVRFPTARGPVRRAPEPTTKEILGPLLGFGANSLLSGLGGLFGKDEPETADEYLKSIGVEDAAIEDKSLLSERDKAQYDAYRIYGAPTEKDGFGLDEIANLAIASQMGRGGPGYIKGVLDSKKSTETDRLNTQVKRQAFLNTSLAPVSLQHLKVQNRNDGSVMIANYNSKKGILTDTNGNELNSDDYAPQIENKLYGNYEDINMTKSSGISTPVMGYVDGLTQRLMVYDPDHPETKSDGFRDASLNYADGRPSSFVKAANLTTQTLAASVNDPDFDAYAKQLGTYRDQDANSISMINAALPAIQIFDEGIKDPKKAPSTFVAGMLNIGNNINQNFKQIAALSSGTDLDGYFALDDAEDDGGYGRGGSGQASKRIYYAYNVTPDGELINGERQYSEAQLKEIAEAERIFEVSTGINIADQFSGLSGFLGDMAYANIRVRGVLLGLAYQAAAANGQTGRTLSDKDLAYHLEMVGFGQSSDPQTQKDILIDFIDTVIDSADDKIRVNLPKEILPANELISDQRYQGQTSTYYLPDQIGVDEGGRPIYNWQAGPSSYNYRPFKDRYSGMPSYDKWLTLDSPGRRLKEGRDQKERISRGGFDKFGTRRRPGY